MVCQPLRLALLIGAITAVAVSPARAHGFRAPRCCDPCGSSSCATAPVYRSACCQWVQECVPVKRTTYKVECRTETYDTCRTECVPVCKEKVVCCVKKVPVWTEQCRKVCHKVTCYEERMVNKTCYKYVQETCMKKQLVRHGHWECREVQPHFHGLFSGHGHGNNCCSDACGSSCNTCPPTRTKKVWVHCPEYRECPVTVCKKVCYTECVKCKVPVCRTEWREEKVKVCTYQCVTENRVVKYTCYETRQVPCKATRTVRVCVPCEETVMCTRWVQKEVACAPAPACTTNACTSNACCNNNTSCCNTSCCNTGHGHFRNRCHGHNRDCCRTTCCCTTTCTTSCTSSCK